MSKTVNLEDFRDIAPLIKGYEFKPGCHYLIVAEGKHFKYDRVHALFAHLREEHPEISVHIVATTDAKALKVMEKKQGEIPLA